MDNNTGNTSPELLVTLLNEEINRLDSYSKRTGINPWVLLAALPGVIWLILPTVESYKYSFKEILLPLLLISVSYDYLITIISILNPGHSKTARNSNFYMANVAIGANRIKIIYEFVRSLAVLIITSYLFKYFPHNGLLYLCAPYIFFFMIMFLFFVLSYFELPINLEGNNKKHIGRYVTLILFTCNTIGLSAIFQIAYNQNIIIDTWKISGSLFIITIIVSLLSNLNKENSPLVYSIINIRRDLILNNISFETALNQTDIIFSGFSISHILQNDIDNMLNKERFISNIIHSLANEYEAIKDAAKINYENKCTLCSSLIRSSQVQMNEVESLTKEYKKVIDKLHLRAKWLISMSPSANTQGELDELFKKIEHSQNHLLSSLKTLQERRLEFKTELSCLETTKQLE